MTDLDFDSWDLLAADNIDAAHAAALDALHGVRTDLLGETVAEIVMRVAAAQPDVIAVELADSRLSYGDLVADARRVAAGLRARGVRRGDVVAVLTGKERALYPFLLAAFAEGVVVASIDTQAPPGRMARCMAICSARLLVTVGVDAPELPKVRVIDVAELRRAPAGELGDHRSGDPASAAYVTFTSGSTGTPKPVLIGHFGLANLVQSYVDIVGITAGHRLTQSAPLHYDASWQQIFAAWCTGATLLPVPDEVRVEPDRMAAWLIDNRLSHWDSVPSLWYPLLDFAPSLRGLNVVLAGEPLRRDAIAQWLGDDPTAGPVLNIYGPSEASIDATFFPIDPATLSDLPGVVPIGRPMGNVRCYVLNESLAPCPVGVTGELYLGGPGLAAGYLSNPAATAERFLPDPFVDEADEVGARMYATGDLVRLTPQGLEFAGRRDEMIKLRGVRIDLTEVSGAIQRIPGVEAAAVVLDRTGEHLVAFLAGSGPDDSVVYRALADQLPPSYLPARLVRVDKLPLTSAGKVDRTLLQRMAEAGEAMAPARATAEEFDPVQRVLADIWEKVLGTAPVTLDDNFFALGGDSITSIVVRDRAATEGLAFDILDLFRGPTVRELAAVARSARAAATRARLDGDRHPLLPGQSTFYWAATTAEHQRDLCVQETYWLAAPVDAEDLAAAMDLLVERHPVLRATFGDDNGVPWQQIVDRPGIGVLRATGDEGTVSWQAQMAYDAIAVDRWPLFDLRIVDLPEGRGALIWTMHHIISDGWSHAILREELFTTYRAIRDGSLMAAEEPAPDHYLDVLGAPEPAVGSPWAFPGPTRLPSADGVGGGVSARHTLTLTAERTAAVTALARQLGLTVNAVMMGAVAATVARFTGSDTVTLMYVSSGRSRVPHPQSAVGCFINTIPLTVDLAGVDAAEAPHRVDAAMRDAMTREGLTAAELCRLAGVGSPRDFSDVLFLYQSYPERPDPDDEPGGPGMSITDYEGFESIVFPLTIVCHRHGDELIFDLDHRVAEVDTGLVEAFAAQLDEIIAGDLSGCV